MYKMKPYKFKRNFKANYVKRAIERQPFDTV